MYYRPGFADDVASYPVIRLLTGRLWKDWSMTLYNRQPSTVAGRAKLA